MNIKRAYYQPSGRSLLLRGLLENHPQAVLLCSSRLETRLLRQNPAFGGAASMDSFIEEPAQAQSVILCHAGHTAEETTLPTVFLETLLRAGVRELVIVASETARGKPTDSGRAEAEVGRLLGQEGSVTR